MTTTALMVLTGGISATLAVLLVVLLLMAWLVSPLLYPRSTEWTVAERSAQERDVPLILWKSGCAYCIRLRLALGIKGRRAVWVDIWADEDAAAATRSLNNGDETTPTVITSTGTRTNPSPSWVRSQLNRHR